MDEERIGPASDTIGPHSIFTSHFSRSTQVHHQTGVSLGVSLGVSVGVREWQCSRGQRSTDPVTSGM